MFENRTKQIARSHWLQFLLSSTVDFQMSSQIAWIRRGIITLFAFVQLFSTVHFQTSPQIACPNTCIITLVTFVWLFSTVRFQLFSSNQEDAGETMKNRACAMCNFCSFNYIRWQRWDNDKYVSPPVSYRVVVRQWSTELHWYSPLSAAVFPHTTGFTDTNYAFIFLCSG